MKDEGLVVHSDPEILGGTPVFVGTRVPLRRAVERGFEVFLTASQTLQFQQNLAQFPLRIDVLVAPSNALEDLLSLVPGILRVIPSVEPGRIQRVCG
jgi:hypothetical protein